MYQIITALEILKKCHNPKDNIKKPGELNSIKNEFYTVIHGRGDALENNCLVTRAVMLSSVDFGFTKLSR